ncbi:hypothetical protein NKF26_11205 [Haladaptatus sp. AB618]|uniref:hypothetical protein n=1 Tax=Haladaptatus sp. AB618 TaxID=2934173 RepID=UPI00209C1091|nr:hypothetical protein [Haladaptatus sp. AB618]MCO8254371.1 hypothetical protein [Haladaptatus sp. AB618]
MKRRAVLTMTAGSLLALAGCVESLGSKSQDSGVVLTKLSIENNSEDPQTVAVDVLYDGKSVYSERHEVTAKEGNVLGGEEITVDFPSDPGEVVIRAKMGNDSAETNLTDEMKNACARVQIWIDSDSSLFILSSNEGTDCFENR